MTDLDAPIRAAGVRARAGYRAPARLFVCGLALLAPLATPLAGGFETYGDVMRVALPVAALGISTAKGDSEGVVQLAASAVPTFGLTYGLKALVEEDRPDHSDDDSFPSAHTSAAFLGASYLHYRYGWEYGLPAYTLASLVAASRVNADKHHVRDVLASAAIANLSAYFLTDPQNDRVMLLPFCDARKPSFGLTAAIRF